MATPKKKYPYNFIYEDGQYMTFDLTNEEHADIKRAMRNEEPAIISAAGIISTKGLRFVVELKEPEPLTTPPVDADPVLDAETIEYLRMNRGEE